MMRAYGLMSDQHCFNWSQFAGTDEIGVNTRLREILREFVRCADAVQAAGGDTIVMAGDLFHQRGAIAPDVFNPTFFTIEAILKRGIKILAIPGNHDLASRETTEVGNAMQTLGGLKDFDVVTKPSHLLSIQLAMMPWISTVDGLKAALEEFARKITSSTSKLADVDLVIHAGIDGVLSGVPAHNLPPSYLASLGFKRVFAGHYHHHCVMEGGKVVSIGATGHQTYSDIGTKAGFLIIHDDRIEHHASHCPSFVEITGDTDPDDVPAIVDGNYVRVRGMRLTDRQIQDARKELIRFGAKGVSFQVERVTEIARTGSTVKPTTSLEMSVASFVTEKKFSNEAAIQARCAQILADVRAQASS